MASSAVGGQRDAWSGNFEKSLYHIFRGILRNVELTTDVCPICLKLRFVASDTRFEQHTCAPAKIERNGRSVPNQVLYQEENRSSVPQGESLLILGPEPFRRILYAMTDSRDKALSAFILGAAADAKRAGDAGVKEFLAETKTHDELKRMAAFAQRVLGWRQP